MQSLNCHIHLMKPHFKLGSIALVAWAAQGSASGGISMGIVMVVLLLLLALLEGERRRRDHETSTGGVSETCRQVAI